MVTCMEIRNTRQNLFQYTKDRLFLVPYRLRNPTMMSQWVELCLDLCRYDSNVYCAEQAWFTFLVMAGVRGPCTVVLYSVFLVTVCSGSETLLRMI